MIAALLAIAAANMTMADGFKANPSKHVLNISLNQAVKNPGLVTAMYEQLDSQFLSNNQLVYVKWVVYKNTVYRITGTWNQWNLFFHHRIELPQKKPVYRAGEQ